VRLIPKSGVVADNEQARALAKVTKTAFAQRRKTLRNNFKGVFDDSVFERVGIEPSARAESLSIEQLLKLSHYLPAV
jgi:16S rRNA (adenine1518-N6/adenine1519-N6)-dimethyltransferase